MTPRNRALAGRTVVVTRPAHQAGNLTALIRNAGGSALLFPVIAIADIDDSRVLDGLIARLDEFDWAMFVSPNAVHKALTLITARRALPSRLAYAAVGSASVRALQAFGVRDVVAPARFDSEALLEMPVLHDIAGKRVIVFRGAGGRDFLGETLMARGASVDYAECYRRVLPPANPAPLLDAWEKEVLHAVTITSSEGLRNLCTLIGAHGLALLQQTPVFVPHPRIAVTARELGLARLVETRQGDEGLMAALQQWFSARA